MEVVDQLRGVAGALPLTPWLVGAGVVALYLAYRAARMLARVAALALAALTLLLSGTDGADGAVVGDGWQPPLPGAYAPGGDAAAGDAATPGRSRA